MEPKDPTIEEIEPFPLDGPPVETKGQEPKIETENRIGLTEKERRQIHDALSFYLERSGGLVEKDEKIIKHLLDNKFLDLEK